MFGSHIKVVLMICVP